MELSALTLRVLLLFFPGVLCAMMVDALTPRSERTPPQFFTIAFVLGVGTYLLMGAGRALMAVLAAAAGWPGPPPITFFDALMDETQGISWAEILLSAGSALLLGIAVTAAVNHHLLHRLAVAVGVSRSFGSHDVWGHVFNSDEIQRVLVRDLATDTLLEGWVDAFSDTGVRPELLLRDVVAWHGSSGAELFRSGRVYLCRSHDLLLVENLDRSAS